jgi:hypothetical protein
MIKLVVLLTIILSITFTGLIYNHALAQAPTFNYQNPFLGDFKCYFPENEFDIFVDDVLLQDQFDTGAQQLDLDKIIRFCNMVEKVEQAPNPTTGNPGFPGSIPPKIFDLNPDTESDTDQHFLVYRLCPEASENIECQPLPAINQMITLTDQFGTTEHIVKQPVELWVPASKDFVIGDPINYPISSINDIHYKCYDISPVPNPLGQLAVGMIDQFLNTNRNILQADKLCNPVIKNGEGTLNNEHLKCYKFLNPQSLSLTRYFSDQFVTDQPLTSPREYELCLVADKNILRSVPVGGILVPVDSTILLLAGTYSTASWLIPTIVSAIGFGIVILRKF